MINYLEMKRLALLCRLPLISILHSQSEGDRFQLVLPKTNVDSINISILCMLFGKFKNHCSEGAVQTLF